MFMPPMERCPVEGCWVRLDRSHAECAAAHGCQRTRGGCPLARYLANGAGVEQGDRSAGASSVTSGPWRTGRKTGTGS